MGIERDQVVRTALRLLDENGLEKLSLRRLAGELGVQAPALYWHVPSKRALLDHMTDVIVAPLVPELAGPSDPAAWPDWLRRTAGLLHEALLAHRDGGAVALGAGLHRAVALGAVAERIVEVLHEAAGLDLADASRGAGTVLQLVIGRTVEEQALTDVTPEALAEVRSRFPSMAAALALRQGPDDDAASFRFAVDLLVEGLRAVAPPDRAD
ncbi:TetR/AcrR family transcriptional regulator C-terminal domain-containing protein [Actinomadura barringtoniae]|uniref:TetR/AcrR family transcriptional regulator C-terminal domain-containing protein n=1 Tax=Actinomadura barringtoniae TaxID=1427535 RepID=A0A939PNM9_9ACTN|nr:TetR family transcriptional regulator [Actinomadura barringtoniae]MBO2453254.1 TetR/AcrR family transcriptional regulator C-terminal domain-containing protein [Actinomadura barringtoniae]